MTEAREWPLMVIDSKFDDSKLSWRGRIVYVHLCRRANKTHAAWPGIRAMATTLCVSQPTVLVGIKELEDRGFIKIAKKFGARSKYKLLPHCCWKPLKEIERSTTFTAQGDLADRSTTFSGPLKEIERKVSRKVSKKVSRAPHPILWEQFLDYGLSKGISKQDCRELFEEWEAGDWYDGKGNPIASPTQKLLRFRNSGWLPSQKRAQNQKNSGREEEFRA